MSSPHSSSTTNLRNFSTSIPENANPPNGSNPGGATGNTAPGTMVSASQKSSQPMLHQEDNLLQNRPYLSYQFLQNPSRNNSKNNSQNHVNLSSYDIKIQELMILEQLLNALMGFDDEYIKCVKDRKTKRVQFYFSLTANVSTQQQQNSTKDQQHTLKNQSLQEIVERILPLCTSYVNVSEFITEYSQYHYGMISHAFCATLRYLLKEYLVVVAQLEQEHKNQKLSLQRMWFYVQPSLKTLTTLDRLTTQIRHSQVKGGALLRCIQQFALEFGGDAQIRQMTEFLIERASVPYFEMLQAWIYKGLIHDPYHEFMVRDTQQAVKHRLVYKEDTSFTEVYWNSRYELVEEQCPRFLERLASKIFTTGKYLNVIRECQIDVQCPFAEQIQYVSNNEREYTEKIEKAYNFASKRLLEVFLVEHKLMDRLRSIKHYFLLDEADFFVHFMDTAEDELSQYAHLIQTSRLNSLLEMAIRTSAVTEDPYKDAVSCSLVSDNLMGYLRDLHRRPRTRAVAGGRMQDDDTMSGIRDGSAQDNTDQMQDEDTRGNAHSHSSIQGFEALVLNYEIGWPLSLVLNKRSMEKYQLLFRHFFFCKYVERQLSNAFLRAKFTRQFSVGKDYAKMNILRHRMLDLIRNFQYYLVEVIEKNYRLMEQKVRTQTSTIEDIMNYHNEFLDTCMRAALLSINVPLFQNLNKILKTCSDFSNFIQQYMQALSADYSQYTNITASTALNLQRDRLLFMAESSTRHANNYQFVTAVDKFARAFDSNLAALSVKLKTVAQNQHTAEQANLLIQLIKINVG